MLTKSGKRHLWSAYISTINTYVFTHVTDITDEFLGFLLTLFENLKVQLGPAVTEQIVEPLLHTFTRQQLSEILHHESTAGSRVINKFLKILQLLVQEPAASFKAFLPNIIGLCMEQLYPILAEVNFSFSFSIVFAYTSHKQKCVGNLFYLIFWLNLS